MKRLLALALPVVMLAACLAGCAGTPETTSAIPANIRLTSSDAGDAAAWLTERLGERLTDRVVIGTDADGLGVDLADLEDDGYLIRSLGDEIALLARTPEGLDRAVRRFAKSAEAGSPVSDATYHEGYRIKELRLAGNDISTYAIAVEGEDEYVLNQATNLAAIPFAKLIKIACGAELEIGGEAQHRIVFRQIADESFKENSFHYFFEGGDLVFEYADILGARDAMGRFLEKECGWDDLLFGCDALREAELIDVPADAELLLHQRFEGMVLTGMRAVTDNTLYNKVSGFYRGRVEYSDHMLGWRWGRDYGYWGRVDPLHLICFTNDDAFYAVYDDVIAYIEERIAAGDVIGDRLASINIGLEDGNTFCKCKGCTKKKLETGNVQSGPMIYFANRLEEAVDEAGYDWLKYPLFAYLGTNQPPTLKPNDDIYVQFVCDCHCCKHDLTGGQCYSVMAGTDGLFTNPTQCNQNYAKWIRGWMELTPNVIGRPAPLSPDYSGYGGFTLLDQTYEDVNHMSDVGVRWIYNEIYSTDESDPMIIVMEMWERMCLEPEMTRTEYWEEVSRLLEKHYGSGWKHMKRYYDMLEEAEIAGDYCWNAWYSAEVLRVDLDLYRENWDEMLRELELAEYEADSARQVDRIRRVRCDALFSGCTVLYFKAYESEDDALLALLRERWDEMFAAMETCGIVNMKADEYILPSLDETMWVYNKDERAAFLDRYCKNTVFRPAPAEYADQAG